MTERVNDQVVEWLEERQGRFILMADEIWANPEVAFTETKSCKLQIDDLEVDGFTITRNVGQVPTAFVAEYTQGEGGPIIGFMGEYDALPGLSQTKTSAQEMLVQGGPGHGCGHNLLGTAALAAASVVKAWLQATNTAATVRYYGCPAEEGGSGKVFMARDGVFDDLDICLTWHPGSVNTGWAGSCLAVDRIKYRFHGRTAHAAANPETGHSSLDAIELMNVGVNYMREHIIDQARIHYVITNGGGAPNVVPDYAESWYSIRAPERHQVEELVERVRNCAKGAALMTGTELEEHYLSSAYNLLPNDVLADHMMTVLEEIGPITFTEEEIAFGKAIEATYPESTRLSVMASDGLPAEELLGQGLNGDVWPITDRGKVMSGSTDVADISWITPVGQVWTACWPLGVPGHSWAITASVGTSIGHKGMLHAAKTMAITAADFILTPELIEAARDEFAERTKDRPYRNPIPDGVKPPIPVAAK